jgi:hypothetical protein
MATDEAVYPKVEQWAAISHRFCRYLGLPNGSAFKIVYKNCAEFPDGRVQRGNTLYRRKAFKKKLQRLSDDLPISTVIRDHLLPYLDIDPALIGTKLQINAYGPNNSSIDTRTYLKNWRNKRPLPTDEEIDAANYRQGEIDEIANETYMHLRDLEELRTADLVALGVLRAMVRSYGKQLVKDAIAEEL